MLYQLSYASPIHQGNPEKPLRTPEINPDESLGHTPAPNVQRHRNKG